MEIIVAKNSGFCFGVKRAINEILKNKDAQVLGDIINNQTVILDLKSKGVDFVYNKEDVTASSVIIRAHGEAKAVFDYFFNKGIKVIDCTCPFVREIQIKVEEYFKNGYKIYILGKANHPEVIGINGWCNNSAIISETGEDFDIKEGEKACVVAQTTLSTEIFDKFLKNIQDKGLKTVEIFKTICYTTTSRQKEAELLSKECDAVLIVGDKNSNNTQKLFDVCNKNNVNSFRIFEPQNFNYKNIKKFRKVGIVLGASTPLEQSQEVISNMESITEVKTSATNEEVKVAEGVEVAPAKKEKEVTMADALAKMTKTSKFRVGQVIRAKISSALDDGLALYIPNTKKEIMLSKDEMLNPYVKEDYENKMDEEIRVMITSLNPVVLSEKAMVKILAEEAEIEEIKNGKVFEVTVTETNKGGLIGKYGSYQVFVPSSQIRIGFVKDLDKYVGKTLKVKAEKVETRGRRQIVASQKVILEAEKAVKDAERAAKEEAFFNSIAVGDVVNGKVVRFASFGAFVSVNGFDCLAHISDLAWFGCKDCAEVLELNKNYDFKVLKIDVENKKVSIGYKQLQPKPWDLVAEKYAVGDVVKGQVVRLVDFGAFVEIEKHIDGLVHVSEITNEWLDNASKVLKVGDEVEAKIMEIVPEKKKITLSMKALLPQPEVVEEVVEEPKAKKGGKKASKKEENVDGEDFREWKDEVGGTSIADLLGNLDK
ncbi:MAG: 4-hydroxy-3-methylbut-2-enyl diphosphate reductase [Clostridiales bacterium]|nr:4-hydroxy-3-methylbut-2-enyl diphosphate reductase [Clostridiales bacterium]